MADIVLANREIYQMVGNFQDDVTFDRGEDKMLQYANSDLFTKKCLMPLESANPEQVAEKIQANGNNLNQKNFLSKLVSLYDIQKANSNLTEYF